MTTYIVDQETSQVPIGEFFQSAAEGLTEIRDHTGKLLATIIVWPESDEEVLYERLFELAERDREIIERRLATPLERCLTTDELLRRLQRLDAEA